MIQHMQMAAALDKVSVDNDILVIAGPYTLRVTSVKVRNNNIVIRTADESLITDLQVQQRGVETGQTYHNESYIEEVER